MTTARFPVKVGAARKKATLSIDRETGLASVRFYRERSAYELHLSDVAEMIHHRVAKEQARQALLERKLRGAR